MGAADVFNPDYLAIGLVGYLNSYSSTLSFNLSNERHAFILHVSAIDSMKTNLLKT